MIDNQHQSSRQTFFVQSFAQEHAVQSSLPGPSAEARAIQCHPEWATVQDLQIRELSSGSGRTPPPVVVGKKLKESAEEKHHHLKNWPLHGFSVESQRVGGEESPMSGSCCTICGVDV